MPIYGISTISINLENMEDFLRKEKGYGLKKKKKDGTSKLTHLAQAECRVQRNRNLKRQFKDQSWGLKQ